MRAHGTRSRSSDERDAAPRHVAAPSAPVQRMLNLQRLAGNAAVARSVEEDRHEHGPGCGHGGVEDTHPTAQRSLLDAARNTPSTSLPAAFLSKAKPFFQNERLSEGRLHDNPIAQRATAALGAEAMTVGKHIFLGPKAVGNTKTLVHEASHLDKNLRGIPETGHDHGAGMTVTDPNQGSERAADHDSTAFMSGAGTAPSVVAQRSVADRTAEAEHAAGAGEAVQRSTAGDAGAAVVQRTGDEDLQAMLHPEYWEGSSKANLKAKANSNKGGQPKKLKKKSDPRRLEQVLTEVVPELLRRLETATGGQLVIYRSMPRDQADEILNWFQNRDSATDVMPMHGHLGDEAQARRYYEEQTGESKAMLAFVLKEGAHELLFTPDYMALGPDGRGADAIRHSERHGGAVFPTASRGEGALEGYIGVKSENAGGKKSDAKKKGFSFNVNAKASRALFEQFVANVVEVS
ncbi:DUF4157 domain-containing protein [Streptomyces sp. NPDC056568]|uniref:eCIS core domain-containing protein n=1 Tax=Streptomyces sp. NPDC056568 TaxID=3345866 RepID=UPI0036B63763